MAYRPLSHSLIDAHTHKKPNVIVIFAESLSANLLDVYAKKAKKYTPNIDRFLKKSMVFYNYYNHAFPSLNGLRGQWCSSFSNMGMLPHVSSKSVHLITKQGLAHCLPNILRGAGYDTTYLTHSIPNRFDLFYLIRTINFNHVYYNFEAAGQLLHSAHPELMDDLSDHEVMQSLWNLVNKKSKEDKPFFIAVSTIQTHIGLPLSPKQDVFPVFELIL